MSDDDRILAMLQQHLKSCEVIVERIDGLERLLNRLFAVLSLFETRLHHVEAEHERLIAGAPSPSPSMN
jgi:hypothetical protein